MRCPAREYSQRDMRIGFITILLSALLFAIMNAGIFGAVHRQPDLSVMVTSFVRILVNLVVVLPLELRGASPRQLWRLRSMPLYLRGVFGSAAMMMFFGSIKLIGMGEASFLQASNGVFVALLAPFVLGLRHKLTTWLAIAGAMVGLFFLVDPRFAATGIEGRLLGLAAAISVAVAFLSMARTGKDRKAGVVILYFCAIGVAMHLVAFPFVELVWPRSVEVWAYLIGAGLAATAAQFCLTVAYQSAPAPFNAALSYSGAVMSMALGVGLYGLIPSPQALVGAGLILIFGVMLPFTEIYPGRHLPWPFRAKG